MNAARRRTLLADVAAMLLVAGATASCLFVATTGESAREQVLRFGLPPIAVALVLASLVWRERRAKLVVALGMVIFAAVGGVAAYESIAPPVYGVPDTAALPAEFRRLAPLHARLTKAEPGDWLDSEVELGQSYSQYIEGKRVRSDDVRRTIYVQPLGEFTAEERTIVDLTAEFLGLFYQLPVRMNENLPLSIVPDTARRTRSTGDGFQIYTSYVLHEVLKPRLPDDAVAMIALTTAGLRRSEKGGGVFGQASLEHRVGVWTMGGLGDPAASRDEFVQMLRRTLHVSVHEAGHMFSIEHCIYYRCCMNGSSGRRELDQQPLWFCPQCQAKVAYATGVDSKRQLTDLATFADRHRLEPEAAFWRRSLAAMEAP